jgi:hypothetical protein
MFCWLILAAAEIIVVVALAVFAVKFVWSPFTSSLAGASSPVVELVVAARPVAEPQLRLDLNGPDSPPPRVKWCGALAVSGR